MPTEATQRGFFEYTGTQSNQINEDVQAMEIIDKNVYEAPACETYLSRLSGISQGFNKTIYDWVSNGNIVEITKDQFDNCLNYQFKMNKTDDPKLGKLVIVDVY